MKPIELLRFGGLIFVFSAKTDFSFPLGTEEEAPRIGGTCYDGFTKKPDYHSS